ncbi:hypothetical protein [Bradyrhizobium sp. Ec3.3]|uniref:hypothetical protein n=1 Tax=Bradyrhizobium sp. Ec3.3 TaxID=189753 RepID=UPI0012EC2F66|nr:hypothetical protein [Bradyrhizobium sp. Ec3.3]
MTNTGIVPANSARNGKVPALLSKKISVNLKQIARQFALPGDPNLKHHGINMLSQANSTNSTLRQSTHQLRKPTPIEALWRLYQAASIEKRRIYALYDEAEAAGDSDKIDQAHAACDAAFEALENIADKIMRLRPKVPAIDLPIKAQVLVGRDHGNGYWAPDVQRFCRDVMTATGISGT